LVIVALLLAIASLVSGRVPIAVSVLLLAVAELVHCAR